MQRRRQSVPHIFEDQIAAEKARLEAQVADAPPGPQKDALLKKIRQLETASHMNEWLSSPGLSRLFASRFFGTAISGSEAEFGRDRGIADVDERALVGDTPLLLLPRRRPRPLSSHFEAGGGLVDHFRIQCVRRGSIFLKEPRIG